MAIYPDASPFLASGWPWWWLLLLLLLLLLCILLTCLLLWCLQGRRKRKRYAANGQTIPLINAEKNERYGGRGGFEDGYSQGFRDAERIDSGTAARRHLHNNFGQRDDRFHEGYAKGLRDAGLSGMTLSMSNLAQKPSSKLGYSSGYMQGFRDGHSGIFGDRITNSLLKRLDEQYLHNDEFKQGYVDGFKDGVSGGKKFEDTRRIQQSLTELTERLTSLEKTKGDEIHSTKIFHVYNQHPDVVGYSATGERLTQELEEIATGTGTTRSTLRRHYTPGDYLKYENEFDNYNSLGRNRRSLSASALAKENGAEHRQRHLSGASYISRGSGLDKQGISDTYSSRRYNYRSQSDVDSPRRYASQTLLDGARPGPTTPHSRKDALQSLQRELDLLSKSPAGVNSFQGAGYNSDTADVNASSNVYDSRLHQRSVKKAYDYDTSVSVINEHEKTTKKTPKLTITTLKLEPEKPEFLQTLPESPNADSSTEATTKNQQKDATEKERISEKYHRKYKEEYLNETH